MLARLLCVSCLFLCFKGFVNAEREKSKRPYDKCMQRQKFKPQNCQGSLLDLMESNFTTVYAYDSTTEKCRKLFAVCARDIPNSFSLKSDCLLYCKNSKAGELASRGCFSEGNWYHHGEQIGLSGCCCDNGGKSCPTCTDPNYCRPSCGSSNGINEIETEEDFNTFCSAIRRCRYGYDYYCDCLSKTAYCFRKCDECFYNRDVVCPKKCGCNNPPNEISIGLPVPTN